MATPASKLGSLRCALRSLSGPLVLRMFLVSSIIHSLSCLLGKFVESLNILGLSHSQLGIDLIVFHAYIC